MSQAIDSQTEPSCAMASLAGNRDLEVRGDIRIGYGMISLTAGAEH